MEACGLLDNVPPPVCFPLALIALCTQLERTVQGAVQSLDHKQINTRQVFKCQPVKVKQSDNKGVLTFTTTTSSYNQSDQCFPSH